MARTTRTLILGIIEVDASIVPNDAAMAPFIDLANEFVTEACTLVNGPNPAYSGTRLELIERWLAAHLYTVRDPRSTSEKAGPVGVNYQSKVDLGFDTSHYGQTAMRIDTNGGLSKINKDTKKGKPTVGGFWAGTEVMDRGNA